VEISKLVKSSNSVFIGELGLVFTEGNTGVCEKSPESIAISNRQFANWLVTRIRSVHLSVQITLYATPAIGTKHSLNAIGFNLRKGYFIECFRLTLNAEKMNRVT